MAEALVSFVVEQLGSIMSQEIEQVVGVEKEVKRLKSKLTAIKAVLTDTETKQVQAKEAEQVREWLWKLKDVAYDVEDVLEDWKASSQTKLGDIQDRKPAGRKVCSFLQSSWFCFKQVGLRHHIANKINELNERLNDIDREKEHYHFDRKDGNKTIEPAMTTSKIDTTEVKGREEDKNKLIDMLLSDGDKPDLRVLSMVGMGGIGKTTLAQFVFNNDRIKGYFDATIWVCVSDLFDDIRVVKAILDSLSTSTPSVVELESLLQKIGESIKEKKFLLVLDDVWEENPRKWEQLKESLKYGSPGSKVLVTTNKEKVALIMGCSKNDILKVGLLSNEECWLIASKIAFLGRNDAECKNLEEIGREISKKCRGLPLAAKALGDILQLKKTREEWQSILESELWKVEKEARRNIIAPLLLSYYDLSLALKLCFSYCGVFPKDYKIEKQMLIELWIAQGYLKQGQGDDLEIIGEHYFQNLIMRFFFQDFQKDRFDDKTITICKMHDSVHDLAQSIGWNECLGVKVNSSVESIIGSLSSKVRHLSLDFSNSTQSFNCFYGTKKLRSLFIWGSLLTSEGLSSLFSEITHVRSLSLRYCQFAEIPSSISKLVLLRFLDLSYNRQVKKLPEILCELYNLQTIDVTDCPHLELPLRIGNLINLRHLHNLGTPTRLSKGIGQLTSLRTLERIDVGCDGDDAFSLGDLKNLNQLRGRLSIINLGAHNRHVDEAKQAKLTKKEHITSLNLSFTSEPLTTGIEELLERLKPSRNLEILSILYYKGTTFPSWMISLTNLRAIRLHGYGASEHLPSLGKLPHLETLAMGSMSSVKKVGVELLGIKTQTCGGKSEKLASLSSSSSSSPAIVAFPVLTKLEFDWMRSWEEWDDCYHGTPVMPSLCSLEITECPRLKALPNYIVQNTMLHTLKIKRSNLLRQRYNEEKGEDWSKISRIPDVRISY